MIRHIFILLTAFMMSSLFNAYAEQMELRSKSLTTINGLPSNTVRHIWQDSKGFIWFGTTNGLCRYDGNTFLNFHAESSNDAVLSLVDNKINKLQEDNHGFLWIGTAIKRYCCYDLHQGKFVDFMGKETNNQELSRIQILPNNDVWLWDNEDGARLIIRNEKRELSSVAFTKEQGNLPDNHIRFIFQDQSGRVWIGTRKGLALYNQGKSLIIDHEIDCFSITEHGQEVYLSSTNGYIHKLNTDGLAEMTMMPASLGKVKLTGTFPVKDKWNILTNKGVFCFEFKTHTLFQHKTLRLNDGKVLIDNHKDYWVYNKSGYVYYIQSKTGKIKEFDFFPKEKVGFIDNERYRIIHTPDDIVWISTYGNGLFAYDIATDKLEHFTAGKEKNNPLISDYILYMAQDKTGGIWISMERAGLQRLTVINRGIQHLIIETSSAFNRANAVRMLQTMKNGTMLMGTGNGKLYTYNSDKIQKKIKDLPANAYAVAQDSKGILWIGTRGAGLKVGDTWYRRQSSDTTSLSGNDIFSIHLDQKERMWIGTLGNGLNLALPSLNGKYTFRRFVWNDYGLNNIRAIQDSKDGVLWVGTSGGLYLLHPDSLINGNTGQCFSFKNRKFCANEIKCLLPDGKNGMWVGTSGGGLAHCIYRNGKLEYEQFTTKNGLVHDIVQSIKRDLKGELWIATEYGMSRFTPKNQSFDNYYFSSYIQGNAYSENTAAIDLSGKLFFGSDYGVTVIDPKKVADNKVSASVVLTNLYINGSQTTPMSEKSPLQYALAYSHKITLKNYQNSLRIEFSVFDYNDSGQTRYKYWLENYEKGWNDASNQSFASYKYLTPGTYHFHVKASDRTGKWNEKETMLEIIIMPPFWKSNWAISLYVLLIVIVSWFTYRIVSNFNKLRTQMKIEEQLTEYKFMFFTNISHEFRTPLTLICGALERIKGVKEMPMEAQSPLQTMSRSTNRMLRLVNQLLTFRELQNNKLFLSLEETDAVAFLYDIYLSFNDLAEQNNINFRFHSSIPTYKIFIDKENLDKIVYNLLSNAFKYTPSGGIIQLSVIVDEERKQLKIQVSDTGVGIPRDKQHELFNRFMQTNFSRDSIGLGLHLTHELVLIHKGTITYSDNPCGGSIFIVCIPTEKSVYSEKDFFHIEKNHREEHTQSALESVEFTAKQQEELEKNISPLNQHKILIIEDDAEVRNFLQEEISKYFQAETAEDGTSGLEKAREYDPDLIVCDVMMPGMNGFEVTHKLKHDFATSHIPIILLTALNSIEKQTKGIDSGADAYISKPFSTKYLVTRIFRLIEQREKLREKYTAEPGMVHAAMYTTDRDREFTEKMSSVIKDNMANPNFSVDDFARQMQLSRTVFYRKTKGLTGYSPIEYLRIIRMKKGAELLLSKENLTVAEVSFRIGINDPFYFSKCFKAQFGISPSVYQKGGPFPPDHKKEEIEL